MRRITLVFALFYLSSCKVVHAQDVAIAYLQLDGEKMGMTICSENNEPIVLLDWRIQGDSGTVNEILTHEMVHVRQAREYKNGGCKGFAKQYQVDPEFRFETELQAYCTNANMAVREHIAKPEVAAEYFARFMRTNYPTKLSETQVLLRVKACLSHGGPWMVRYGG